MFNDDLRYVPVPNWNPTEGGGFTPTETQLAAINSGATTEKINSIANKLDKLTDEGEFVYTHEGEIQNSKGFIAGDTLLNSSAHVPSAHTVKKYVDDLTEIVDITNTITKNDTYIGTHFVNAFKHGKLVIVNINCNVTTQIPINTDFYSTLPQNGGGAAYATTGSASIKLDSNGTTLHTEGTAIAPGWYIFTIVYYI